MPGRGRAEQHVAAGWTEPPGGLGDGVEGGIAGEVAPAAPTGTGQGRSRSQDHRMVLILTRGTHRCRATVMRESAPTSSWSGSSLRRSRVPHSSQVRTLGSRVACAGVTAGSFRVNLLEVYYQQCASSIRGGGPR